MRSVQRARHRYVPALLFSIVRGCLNDGGCAVLLPDQSGKTRPYHRRAAGWPGKGPGNQTMQFGVFDHMDRGATPLDRFYAERLRLVEAYDRASFYGYHVAEHHSTPLGVAPCPGIWLSAVAEHTKQLRFGPLVYLLPLYHPIKLLEEICMLDQMSRGRFLLGVGRGISPIELSYYGVDPV